MNVVLIKPEFVSCHYGDWSILEWLFKSWFF